jgi:folate-dependent phosphoribosylglycinamide formyltransferase PurN
MIFVVTSTISYEIIRNQFSKFSQHESISFLIYDYCDCDGNAFIENNALLYFNFGEELDGYLLERACSGDILINFDGFHVFSKEVIGLFDGRSANFHPSLLPAYGGINPISWGLFNGENKWGYSWT